MSHSTISTLSPSLYLLSWFKKWLTQDPCLLLWGCRLEFPQNEGSRNLPGSNTVHILCMNIYICNYMYMYTYRYEVWNSVRVEPLSSLFPLLQIRTSLFIQTSDYLTLEPSIIQTHTYIHVYT